MSDYESDGMEFEDDGSESGPPGKKRANHNELERKRRQCQKQKLLELREAIPSIRLERPSAIQILGKAKEYIDELTTKSEVLDRELASLRTFPGSAASLPPPPPPPKVPAIPIPTTKLGRPTKASKAEENAELEKFRTSNAQLKERLEELKRKVGLSSPSPRDLHSLPSPIVLQQNSSPFRKSFSPLPRLEDQSFPYESLSSEQSIKQEFKIEPKEELEGEIDERDADEEQFNSIRQLSSSEDYDSFPTFPSSLPSLPQPGTSGDPILLSFPPQIPLESPLPSPSQSPAASLSPSPTQIQIPSTRIGPKQFEERDPAEPSVNYKKRKSRADNDFELARREYYQRRNSTVEDMRDHQQRINEVGLLHNFAVQARRASLPSAFLEDFNKD